MTSRKTLYEDVLATIRRECPPEHYIALNPARPEEFAVDKSPRVAVRKLRERGYQGEAFVHYQLRADETSIFESR